MRFFDYKFLILLGLTLVVYFIYREVEYLRNKLEKLENQIKNYKITTNSLEFDDQSKQLLKKENYKPILSLPKINNDNTSSLNHVSIQNMICDIPVLTSLNIDNNKHLSPSRISPKIIKIDQDKTNKINNTNDINEQSLGDSTTNQFGLVEQSSSIKIVKQKINNIISKNDSDNSEYESDIENTSSNLTSESSKHLAIYSNDNEQIDSTQNSLMESVEANKNDLKFDYNRMEISNLKSTMESIMNSLSTDSDRIEQSIGNSTTNPIEKSPIDEIIDEKEKQLSEMKKSASLTSSENKDLNDVLDDNKLNNMKMQELKKIAEKYKIQITKKINGQQKIKNKTELINDILSKLDNN